MIHAQLELASLDAYTMLHLIIKLPVTTTVRTHSIVNGALLGPQFSIVRLPLMASTFLFPFTAYASSARSDGI